MIWFMQERFPGLYRELARIVTSCADRTQVRGKDMAAESV